MAHKGHQIVGAGPGRPRGSKNRANLATHADLLACLDELNFDPIREMVALYHDSETHNRVKYEICKEIVAYVYPKRKSVDTSIAIEHNNLNISWNIDPPSSTVSIPSDMTVAQTVIPHEPSQISDDTDEDDR